jgi:hypothetical protein
MVSGRLKSTVGLVLAAHLAAGLAAGEAQAAVSRSGVISKFDGVDEIVEACTTATSFVNVPQMSRTFTVAGGSSSVVVTFSAAASLSETPFDTGFVRLLIDGQQQSPGVVPFVAAGESGSHAFTWQSRPLAVGSHTARVQYRTDLASQFCVDARSLIILHR